MKKIILKNINKTFNQQQVLTNINFEIKEGKILGIIGPNGAGKTTIIKILGNYLKQDSGIITSNLKDKNINVGVSFGGTTGFYNEATVKDNLKFYANLENNKFWKNKQIVEQVIEQIQLKEYQNRKVGELSLGYKQKMHIARALLGSPTLLLLDEPTNGLDIQAAKDLRILIKQLALQGKLVIITSHNMHELENIVDEIILLNKGKIEFAGELSKIYDLVPDKAQKNVKNLEQACLAIFESWQKNENDCN